MRELLLSLWYGGGIFLGLIITLGLFVYVVSDIQDRFSYLSPYLHILAPFIFFCVLVLFSLVSELTPQADAQRATSGYLGLLGTIFSLLGLAAYISWRNEIPATPPPRTIFDRGDVSSPPAPQQQVQRVPPPIANRYATNFDPLGRKPSLPDVFKPIAYLTVQLSSLQEPLRWPLAATMDAEIGRSPDVRFILTDGTVSRRHARIKHVNGATLLVDLGSSSGTYVNGQRIRQQQLNNNDRIQLGRVQMIYRVATA